MNVTITDPEDRPTLLIVDDDRVFTDVVSRALANLRNRLEAHR